MYTYTEVLSESTLGKVWISECGGYVKVDFANVVLIHSYKAFLAFYNNIEDCYSNVAFDLHSTSRDICFTTRMPNLFLQFSVDEITELFDLLQSAILQYEINV